MSVERENETNKFCTHLSVSEYTCEIVQKANETFKWNEKRSTLQGKVCIETVTIESLEK